MKLYVGCKGSNGVNDHTHGGGGGGASAVLLNNQVVAVAGGGGGASGMNDQAYTSDNHGHGGAGAYPTGGIGLD